MARKDTGRHDRVHVIGALTEPHLQDLLEDMPGGQILLDLAQVGRVDAEAVSLLANLPPGRCRLLDCPKWLSLRIEQELACT